MSQALRSGAKASLLGALGVITGNALYSAVSALGLGAILIASEVLFYLIKWTGATYLVYLGGKMLYDSLGRQLTMSHGAVAGDAQSHLFRQGLLTQLANPKAILFFTAILPQFINPQASASLQLALLGMTSIVIEFPVLVMYGWLAHTGGHVIRQGRYGQWIDRCAGTFLIGAGSWPSHDVRDLQADARHGHLEFYTFRARPPIISPVYPVVSQHGSPRASVRVRQQSRCWVWAYHPMLSGRSPSSALPASSIFSGRPTTCCTATCASLK
jgi:homoserine/homoserine lactone efflux protein